MEQGLGQGPAQYRERLKKHLQPQPSPTSIKEIFGLDDIPPEPWAHFVQREGWGALAQRLHLENKREEGVSPQLSLFGVLGKLLWPGASQEITSAVRIRDLARWLVQEGIGHGDKELIAVVEREMGVEPGQLQQEAWATKLDKPPGIRVMLYALSKALEFNAYLLEIQPDRIDICNFSCAAGKGTVFLTLEDGVVGRVHKLPPGAKRSRHQAALSARTTDSFKESAKILNRGTQELVSLTELLPGPGSTTLSMEPGHRAVCTRTKDKITVVHEEFEQATRSWHETGEATTYGIRRGQQESPGVGEYPAALIHGHITDALKLGKKQIEGSVRSALEALNQKAKGDEGAGPSLDRVLVTTLQRGVQGLSRIGREVQDTAVFMGREGGGKSTASSAAIEHNVPDQAELKERLKDGDMEDEAVPNVQDDQGKRALLGALQLLKNKEGGGSGGDGAGDVQDVGEAAFVDEVLNRSVLDDVSYHPPANANGKPLILVGGVTMGKGVTAVPARVEMQRRGVQFQWSASFANKAAVEADVQQVAQALGTRIREKENGVDADDRAQIVLDPATIARVEAVCGLTEAEALNIQDAVFEDLDLTAVEDLQAISDKLQLPEWLEPLLGHTIRWWCRTSDRNAALQAMRFLSLCFTVGSPVCGVLEAHNLVTPGKKGMVIIDAPGLTKSESSIQYNAAAVAMLRSTVTECIRHNTRCCLVYFVGDRSLSSEPFDVLKDEGLLQVIALNPEHFKLVGLQCIDSPGKGAFAEAITTVPEAARTLRAIERSIKTQLEKVLKSALRNLKDAGDAAPGELIPQYDQAYQALHRQIPRMLEPCAVDTFGVRLNKLKGEHALLDEYRLGSVLERMFHAPNDYTTRPECLLVVLADMLLVLAPLALALTVELSEEDKQAIQKAITTGEMVANRQELRRGQNKPFSDFQLSTCSPKLAAAFEACKNRRVWMDQQANDPKDPFKPYFKARSTVLHKHMSADKPSDTPLPNFVIGPMLQDLPEDLGTAWRGFFQVHAEVVRKRTMEMLQKQVLRLLSGKAKHLCGFVESAMPGELKQGTGLALARSATLPSEFKLIAQNAADRYKATLKGLATQGKGLANKRALLARDAWAWARIVEGDLKTNGFGLAGGIFAGLEEVGRTALETYQKVLKGFDQAKLRTTDMAMRVMGLAHELSMAFLRFDKSMDSNQVSQAMEHLAEQLNERDHVALRNKLRQLARSIGYNDILSKALGNRSRGGMISYKSLSEAIERLAKEGGIRVDEEAQQQAGPSAAGEAAQEPAAAADGAAGQDAGAVQAQPSGAAAVAAVGKVCDSCGKVRSGRAVQPHTVQYNGLTATKDLCSYCRGGETRKLKRLARQREAQAQQQQEEEEEEGEGEQEEEHQQQQEQQERLRQRQQGQRRAQGSGARKRART